jgi:hypothetical protein
VGLRINKNQATSRLTGYIETPSGRERRPLACRFGKKSAYKTSKLLRNTGVLHENGSDLLSDTTFNNLFLSLVGGHGEHDGLSLLQQIPKLEVFRRFVFVLFDFVHRFLPANLALSTTEPCCRAILFICARLR